jgi:3-oxoacyl-(acyl-carrier-protein) synthase
MGVRTEHGEPVAIIGMACRFPGAGDPAEFHELTVTGRSRFEPTAGLEERPLHAALLDDWAVPFSDPDGSGSGEDLGPVQKLAAETAALALADAGLREAAGTSRTGMIIASSAPGVCEQVREQFGVAAGGPYPDAAYHSSLHAVAGAASALQAGLVDLAIAGGVELGINLAWLARQAQAGVLGTDEMRVYAADPSGLLPGEGCGMVVLVRAADARAAGVPVYAELAGWSTVPAGSGTGAGGAALAQAGLLRAYERAGIDPAGIQLIEGTGMGTASADAAEIEAFAQLRQGSQAAAALSAVSACIGYTKAAAGVASLVKVASAMAAGTVPPGPGCVRPHPVIESGDARLRWPEHAEPWPDGNAGTLGNQGPRLAAVNSLGTADPAELAAPMAGPRDAGRGPAGPRGPEGVHLVLRRDGEARHTGGRRRRAASGTVAPAAPGKHTTASPPPASTPAVSTSAAATPAAAPPVVPAGTQVAPSQSETRAASPQSEARAARPQSGIQAERLRSEAQGVDPGMARVPQPRQTQTSRTDPPASLGTPEKLAGSSELEKPEEATQTQAAPTSARPAAPGRKRGMSPEVQGLLPRVLAALSRLPVGPQDSPAPSWPDERDIQAARDEAARGGAGQAAPVLPRRVPGSAFAARAVEHPTVFALCGGDPGELAARLDFLVDSAIALSATELSELARQLAVGAAATGAELAASGSGGPRSGPGGIPALLRVGLTAGTPQQLAAEARHAAQMLRASGPDATATGPEVRISAGAGGSVVLLFPGRPDSVAGQSMQLVTSLQALDTLDALDVRPVAAVGYGLGGEIAALAWAGCLPETEAARLVALCGQALRSCACGPAAMARVSTDAETAQALYAPGPAIASSQLLHICAYEGPRTHVLTGPAAGIREMGRRARELGISVEMLTAAASLHSPAMTRCAAPLRGVFAGTCFEPPRRRLFSTVTGRLLTPQDDIARLLTQIVSLPVLFSQAMSAAAKGADLIVAAAPPDAGLTGQAAGYGVPAVAIPASTRPGLMDAALAQALAALFTAGAVTDLTPYLAPARPLGSTPWDTLASKTVPRMRVAEPQAAPDAPQAAGAGNGVRERTAARSEKLAGQGPGLFPVRPQRHPGGAVRG